MPGEVSYDPRFTFLSTYALENPSSKLQTPVEFYTPVTDAAFYYNIHPSSFGSRPLPEKWYQTDMHLKYPLWKSC